MRSSSAPLSWARFIMLSLSGARQTSGNRVRISIVIGKKKTSNAQRRTSNLESILLHDLERGPLSVTRGGAGQQRADRLDRLPVAPNDSADVGLAQLDPEDRGFPGRNLREHHLIRKLDELANDEFEKLLHEPECRRTLTFVTPRAAVDRALRRAMGNSAGAAGKHKYRATERSLP